MGFMSEYQVIARKFRPQSFKDVLGQEATITTLKNAIKFKRLAQAYLFSGSRGTGKTTLARILAKAINCQHTSDDFEPCNQCRSCIEITSGASLDVLEMDGASHRGIEDIRQINDTVAYAVASGYYKIYIIDEVHMLTKEAFNALLKTLEEPPPKVKFFFATTEPHKIPATILSRCQRFNLKRIPLPQIIVKLKRIIDELRVEVDEEALLLIGQRAEGGLRDAESLLDQILSFTEEKITAKSVSSILGIMPREIFFAIDEAGKNGQFAKAFEIADQVFSEGKDLTFFIEGLISHIRTILLLKLSNRDSPLLVLTDLEKNQYEKTAKFYTQEQCLDLVEYLLEAQEQLKLSGFGKFSLEAILLHVMRSHFRLPIEYLVQRLHQLEEVLSKEKDSQPSDEIKIIVSEKKQEPLIDSSPEIVFKNKEPLTVNIDSPSVHSASVHSAIVTKSNPLSNPFLSEDPTPLPADLPVPVNKQTTHYKQESNKTPAQRDDPPLMTTDPETPLHKYDTLLYFAAVELEGKLQKS